MSVASSATQPAVSVTSDGSAAVVRRRLVDYAELCRPRIAMMTMVSVAVGFTLASPIVFNGTVLLVALLGITLLVAASSILNQCLERATDSRMNRTAARPVAGGRISAKEAVAAAAAMTFCGTVVLWNFVNPLTAIATLSTLVVYAFGYTLLKTRSSLCTTIGAVPGAMPPVLGWLAAGGQPGAEAMALFSVFFIWQFPHFLAIGWIHRKDYEHAGLRMLPSFTDKGLLTGLFAVVYAAAFVPVSTLPAHVGMSGDLYLAAALILSFTYLVYSVRFLADRTEARARKLLYNSLLCLPLLLAALVFDFLRLTSMG